MRRQAFDFVTYWNNERWIAITLEQFVVGYGPTRDLAIKALEDSLVSFRRRWAKNYDDKNERPRVQWYRGSRMATPAHATSRAIGAPYVVTGTAGDKMINYRGTVRVEDDPTI